MSGLDANVSKRLFVGGLSENVTAAELSQRFSHFGSVSNISFKTRLDDAGSPLKCFAHLDLYGKEADIKKCFNTYQNAKWKGSVMKLQYAKESVLERLQKEREANKAVPVEPCRTEQKLVLPPTDAKGVPGTPLPGKKDWVVGKYGRALPILRLKKSPKVLVKKHDPSKFCHAAKVFKVEGEDEQPCGELTWEINDPDSDITKKRKGEFLHSKSPPKSNHISLKENLKIIEAVKQRTFFQSDHFNSSDQRGRKLSVQATVNDSEKLEVVKVGAVMIKPQGLRKSTKFDSDLEDSDTELKSSTMKNKATRTQAKSNGFVKSPGASSRQAVVNGSSVAVPEFKGLSMFQKGLQKEPSVKKFSDQDLTQQLLTTSKGVDTQCALSNNSKNTHGSGVSVPEFKGLSMLSAQLNRPKLEESLPSSPSVCNSAESKTEMQSKSTEKSNLEYQNTSRPKVSPAMFSNEPLQTKSNRIMRNYQPIPEFRGIGMLADLNTQQQTKNESDVVSKKVDSHDKPSISNEKPGRHPVVVSPTKDKLEGPPPKKARKLLEKSSPSKSLDNVRFDSESADPPKRSSHSTDSDSSADTDEIILRHKTEKKDSSAFQSQSSELWNKVKVPKFGVGVADKSLLHSEFVSSELDDYDPPRDKNVRGQSPLKEDDSYDSDLDSNDFALVVRKLQQQSQTKGRIKALVSQKALSLNTTSPSVPLQVQEKAKDAMTGLQSRLASIAGVEMKKPSDDINSPKSENKEDKKSNNLKLSEQDKHKMANEKRLQAMKEQAKHRQQQHELMKQALKNVDSAQDNSKRIVFESSSDDSDEDEKYSKPNSSSKTTHVGPAMHQQKKSIEDDTQNKAGQNLFASSDDDSDDNYDEMFKSKPYFEGKKGEKLLKLEKSFGGDKRFQLDAKFADSDTEEHSDDNEEEVEKDTEETTGAGKATEGSHEDLAKNLKEEKSASLKVLENIVGKNTLDRFSEKINRNTKKIIDMNTVRFDPTKLPKVTVSTEDDRTTLANTPDTKLRKKTQPETKKSTEKETISKTDVQKKIEVSQQDEDAGNLNKTLKDDETKEKPSKKEKAKMESSLDAPSSKAELSSSLLDIFKSKASDGQEEAGQTEGSFSLLQQFGNVDREDEKEPKGKGTFNFEKWEKSKPQRDDFESTGGKIASIKEIQKSDLKSKFTDVEDTHDTTKDSISDNDMDDDDDDDDDDEMEEEDNDGQESKKEETSLDLVKDTDGIDSEMIRAGKVDIRFTKEEWHEQWDTLRQSIIKIYKRKHKDALKKKRVQGEQKRKREFLKNSKRVGRKNWRAPRKT